MTYPKIDFLYLSEQDMIEAGVRDMDACIDAMEEVLKCLAVGDFMMGGENHMSHGTMVTFPKTSQFPNMPIAAEARRFMAMPAYIGGSFDMAGVKWYGSNMENKKLGLPRSILMIMLNDKTTGAPKVLMSGNLESAYRTGAVQGVGVRHLIRKGAKVCGIFGPGVMGKTALDAFVSACPSLDTLKIKGRSRKSIDSLIEYAKKNYPQFKKITVCKDLEEMVRGTDVMTFTASTGQDVNSYEMVKGEWVKPGALLVAPSGINMETDFLAKKARLVVDSMGLYHAWAEEYPYPTFGSIDIIGSKFTDMVHDGIITENQIDDMGDILLGKAQKRKSDDEIIVYSVGGMPVEDVAWGKICYDKAVEKGLGISLNLWNKPCLA